MITFALTAFVIGFLCSLYASMIGMGGAFFLRPLIRIFLEVPGKIALGTPAALNILSAGVGAYTYNKKGLINKKIAVITGVCGGVTAVIGARLTVYFSGKQMMLIIAGVTLFVASVMIFKKEKKVIQDEVRHLLPKNIVAKSVVSGLFIGLCAGFLGLGGGFILMPLYMLFFRLKAHTAVATSLLSIVIISIPSTITHYMLGNIDLLLLLFAGSGAFIGSKMSAHIACKLKQKTLKTIVIVSYVVVAVALIYFELSKAGLQ